MNAALCREISNEAKDSTRLYGRNRYLFVIRDIEDQSVWSKVVVMETTYSGRLDGAASTTLPSMTYDDQGALKMRPQKSPR